MHPLQNVGGGRILPLLERLRYSSPPRSFNGCSVPLPSTPCLFTSLRPYLSLLCYAKSADTHESRIRLTHRQNSWNPDLFALHVGFHLCRHHLHHRFAVPAGTSRLDGHPALCRGRG